MNIIIKSVVSFFVLLFFTRVLGKKQMNQITYFDYITGITLGSIAASVSVEEHVTLTIGLISFVTWSALAFLISFITLKSYKARIFFDGEPDIIIKKGKIMHKVIKKAHLNMDDVTMLLREKNVFSISDVEYAVLEPHGKLSILKKGKKYLPTDIIIDGQIIRRNLLEIGQNDKWLLDELTKVNLSLSDVKRVFYMGLQEDGSVYISLKEEGQG
jgi:uncharacterized membrane protein YcaP (DUF421 family)